MKAKKLMTNDETKKLTHIGIDKTFLSLMDTQTLTNAVNRYVGGLLTGSGKLGADGHPTAAAIVAAEALNDYVEGQMKLFSSRGLPKERAYSEAIVPTGVIFTNSRGERLEQFRIVRRDKNLEPVEADNINEAGAGYAAQRSPSHGVGIERESWRGKYHDGQLLIDQAGVSVDLSEYVSFSF